MRPSIILMPMVFLMACRGDGLSVSPVVDSVVNSDNKSPTMPLDNKANSATELWPANRKANHDQKEGNQCRSKDSPASLDLEKSKRLCAPLPKIVVRDPDFRPVARRLKEVMAYTGTQGAAMAVALGRKIIWEQGIGWANRERKIRATADTPFSMASISKPFTATAIMILEEQGLIELDAPINNYLGNSGVWAGAGEVEQATIRRVLSHRAGLPVHAHFYYADRPYSIPSPAETMKRYAALITPPGERYRYSNLGYGILGFLISQVSGQKYEEFMRENIFGPLGMEHSDIGIPPKYRRQAAIRYKIGGERLSNYTVDHPAASSIYASVHDLAVFGLFHLGSVQGNAKRKAKDRADSKRVGEVIVSSDRLKQMRVPMEEDDHYGLGWGVGRKDGLVVFGHNGAMFGVSSKLSVFPEQDLVIAIAGNSKTMRTRHHWLVQKVLEVLGAPARSDAICDLPQDHGLINTWSGSVQSPEGTIPFGLEVKLSGEVYATINHGKRQVVRGVDIKEGVLQGLFEEDIGAEQVKGEGILELELRLRERTLEGAVISIDPVAGVVSHWIRLEPNELH